MEAIADGQGFSPTTLLTTDATAEAVIASIMQASEELAAGDIFLLTYSGHGGHVPDENGDEPDAKDETWALFDRQLVDDELYAAWGKFAAGVRIAVFSDSCYSGTVAKVAFYQASPSDVVRISGHRGLPPSAEEFSYELNHVLYGSIQNQHPKGHQTAVGASVILISGCQDTQLSADGPRNGLFTQTLLEVWDDGRFSAGYKSFRNNIARRMPPDQVPNYYVVGTRNHAFEAERPFTI